MSIRNQSHLNLPANLLKPKTDLLKSIPLNPKYEELKNSNLISNYSAPKWAKQQINPEHIPTEKLNLSSSNTPVQKWLLSEVPEDFNLFIKREDLNGSTLGGNKIKKLEFSLAKAIKMGCNHIITTGTILSNHCRTTALCCAQLGLKCTLLQTSNKKPDEILTRGNTLLSLLSGAECILLPADKSREEVNDFLDQAMAKSKKEGYKPFLIYRGGTQGDAIFSYINVFQEMLNQPAFQNAKITDIVCTSGSGGTAISLALAAKLSKSNIKVHAMRVWGNNHIGHEILKGECKDIGLDYENYKDCINYIDDYVGEGYGVSNLKIENTVLDSISKTGVGLCTTYTGKAVTGMLDLMKVKPEEFNGKNVLFMHTGGIPGMWGDSNLFRTVERVVSDGRIQYAEDYFGSGPGKFLRN